MVIKIYDDAMLYMYIPIFLSVKFVTTLDDNTCVFQHIHMYQHNKIFNAPNTIKNKVGPLLKHS